jgi:ferredoxin
MLMKKIKTVTALFFSPTYTTKKCVVAIAKGVAEGLAAEYRECNITTPLQRRQTPEYGAGDLVVFGVPVYIGRVPNLFRDYFASIKGNGAIGVPVVVYGNRAYDDALIELRDIMQGNGFQCMAAGAFIGEHSFSYTLGGGRPDTSDLQKATAFGEEIARQLLAGAEPPHQLQVPGNPYPYTYFDARSGKGKSIDLRKVKPETDPEKCTNCGYCAMLCPMGAIDPDNCSEIPGKCIRCCACVKLCRPKAKYFADETYLEHKAILEEKFTEPRREPENFW